MSQVVLTVLYPWPSDAEKFNADYEAHLELLNEKAGIPSGRKPYSVVRFLAGPDGNPPFYQSFSMEFSSAQALQEAMSTAGMQEVAADAERISTGGKPTILIGEPKH
ncbi:EthD family reductase [uncultured Roseibium sp.]|uniref:EthD family reductase n=1 Tax=uncultured Roseibium sp. TaxID=1936171 RepID=UPI00261DBF39|nr:EthD family reductase [uncultured Roseibium sp.]